LLFKTGNICSSHIFSLTLRASRVEIAQSHPPKKFAAGMYSIRGTWRYRHHRAWIREQSHRMLPLWRYCAETAAPGEAHY